MLTKINGARVVDPGKNIDGILDVWIRDASIEAVTAPGEKKDAPDLEVDGTGKILCPGLIDIHVHLREPGFEYKETVETGTHAAVAGGFTAVCCMPNTRPVLDTAQTVSFVLRQAEKAGYAKVYPVAAITFGLSGSEMTELKELKAAGAVAVTDDGMPVADARMMRRAMEYAMGSGLFVISHCEDLSLAGKGVMNEGPVATRLGLPGIPNLSESLMVMREIELSALTGARVHLAHISTRESVDAIQRAKKRGLPVTAETAPHYFALTEADVGEYNTNAKMNPPLRSEEDRQAVIQGLKDGILDVIATDHAPHAQQEKMVPFDQAPNGVIGLETSLAVSLGLVHSGCLTISELIDRMAVRPAAILGIDHGIVAGNPADLTLIDEQLEWTVDARMFKSKSRNTPFDGQRMKGRATHTWVGGRLVFSL